MDHIRWFFALSDTKEDVYYRDELARRIARDRRRQKSPLWRFIWRCESLCRAMQFRLIDAWTYLWQRTLGHYVYVKGSRTTAEAATMRFVSSHTSIPIPRIWMTFNWGEDHYIFMERINGAVLEDVWDRLSEELKGVVIDQVGGYVSQLRALSPPAGLKSICSIQGGPIWCFRLHFDGKTGPFRDEEHMNLQLRHLKPLKDFAPIIQTVHERKHPLVFTHNDLFPRNIVVEEKTGEVLAILDWESAGWFPAHWEYCKCVNWGDWRPEQRDWKKWVPRMIPIYDEEAEADRVLMYESGILELSPTVHA